MKQDVFGGLEQTGEEYSGLYGLFQDKGDKAVDIFYHAEAENYHLPLAEEVYDEVGNQGSLPPFIRQREFESIVNFLSRAEVLPAWNSSAPFRIRMEDIDEALLATAYEKVSGGKYSLPEDTETVEPDVKDCLRF